jgi:hypothetical protein
MSENKNTDIDGPAKTNADDQGRQLAHIRAAELKQQELIRRMTPQRRLAIARELYETAWQTKETSLRRQYPDWSDREIQANRRRILLTGHAGT